ncbi:GM14733 [Drosophila sechellia]|nr:GM14733 [Drosophila sechellia]
MQGYMTPVRCLEADERFRVPNSVSCPPAVDDKESLPEKPHNPQTVVQLPGCNVPVPPKH